MQDTGINDNQFLEVIQRGLKSKQDKRIFEQIFLVDNFLVFKKLMAKRNKDFELQALQEISQIK